MTMTGEDAALYWHAQVHIFVKPSMSIKNYLFKIKLIKF